MAHRAYLPRHRSEERSYLDVVLRRRTWLWPRTTRTDRHCPASVARRTSYRRGGDTIFKTRIYYVATMPGRRGLAFPVDHGALGPIPPGCCSASLSGRAAGRPPPALRLPPLISRHHPMTAPPTRHADGVPDLVTALAAERSRPCALESSASPCAPPVGHRPVRRTARPGGAPVRHAGRAQPAAGAWRTPSPIVVAGDIDDEEPTGDVGPYGSIDVAVYDDDGVLLGGRAPAGPEPLACPGPRAASGAGPRTATSSWRFRSPRR